MKLVLAAHCTGLLIFSKKCNSDKHSGTISGHRLQTGASEGKRILTLTGDQLTRAATQFTRLTDYYFIRPNISNLNLHFYFRFYIFPVMLAIPLPLQDFVPKYYLSLWHQFPYCIVALQVHFLPV